MKDGIELLEIRFKNGQRWRAIPDKDLISLEWMGRFDWTSLKHFVKKISRQG